MLKRKTKRKTVREFCGIGKQINAEPFALRRVPAAGSPRRRQPLPYDRPGERKCGRAKCYTVDKLRVSTMLPKAERK